MPVIATGDLHAEASARGGEGLRGRDMFIGDARTADEQPALDAHSLLSGRPDSSDSRWPSKAVPLR